MEFDRQSNALGNAMTRHRRRSFALGLLLLSLGIVQAGSSPASVADKPVASYYEAARDLYASGDYDAALIQIKNALQADARDLPSRLLLGRISIALNRGTEAEAAFRAA